MCFACVYNKLCVCLFKSFYEASRNDRPGTVVMTASPALLSLLLLPMSAATPASAPVTLRVASASATTHQLNPLHLGCHSDSGFTHQVYGFSSQMIFGESFERPQPNVTYGQAADAWSYGACTSCGASSVLDHSTVAPAMHGASSRNLTIKRRASGGEPTLAALFNRGLANEGLFFEGGKPYEGYLYARCAAPVTLVLRLEDYTERASSAPSVSGGGAVLAERRVSFGCGATAASWVRVEFELTPVASTRCEGIAVGSDPHVPCTSAPPAELGHSCVRCGGQFSVGLGSVGSVGVDFVTLQPGAWGRLVGPAGPLPVRATSAELLRAMGVRHHIQDG